MSFCFRIKCLQVSVKSICFTTSVSFFTMSLFSFCFQDLSIDESGVLKSPTITVCSAMCVLSFTKISLMNVDALAFGAQILRIESSSWKILPLMSVKCPPYPQLHPPCPSFFMTLGWSSILFDTSMATPSCFQGPCVLKIVLQPFTRKQCLSLRLRYVSWTQENVVSCLCIQSAMCVFLLGN